MRLTRFCVTLLGMAVLISAASAKADGWEMPKLFPSSQKQTKKSGFSTTLKRMNAGTKKFIHGTVDVITLKPLWKPEKEPVDPWMRHTQKEPEKKPFWDSWFTPEEEPKRAATVGEWVGMDRPE